LTFNEQRIRVARRQIELRRSVVANGRPSAVHVSAMRVLVTGATGFIGRHLVRSLVDRGDEVRALVRPTSDTAELRSLGVDLFEGDLTLAASLAGCCDGIDAVLHTGCAVKGTFDAGRDAEKAFLAVNRDGTVNLAREVLKHDGLRLVHVSSTAAMGAPKASHVDETSPCNPKAPYQVSKREAELALLELHDHDGLNVVILRPCLVAGEGKVNGELLKLFRMVRKGRLPYIGNNFDIEKPLIMVDDLVDAIILAATSGDSGAVYLIHSGGHHTMGHIIATCGRLTGAKRTHIRVPVRVARAIAHGMVWAGRLMPRWNPPLTPERIDLFLADRQIDISKAEQGLGFKPRFQDLDVMLGRTYRWYIEEGMI
jgi:nucleoside-diphosphate-sugar epimerase